MGILGFGRYVGNVYIAKDKAHIFYLIQFEYNKNFLGGFWLKN
jgi:hypothetical protein